MHSIKQKAASEMPCKQLRSNSSCDRLLDNCEADLALQSLPLSWRSRCYFFSHLLCQNQECLLRKLENWMASKFFELASKWKYFEHWWRLRIDADWRVVNWTAGWRKDVGRIGQLKTVSSHQRFAREYYSRGKKRSECLRR